MLCIVDFDLARQKAPALRLIPFRFIACRRIAGRATQYCLMVLTTMENADNGYPLGIDIESDYSAFSVTVMRSPARTLSRIVPRYRKACRLSQ